MTTTLTKDALADAAARLGDDKFAVAKTLADLGIKGNQRAASSCPVANYLRKEFPDVYYVQAYTAMTVERTPFPDEEDYAAIAAWEQENHFRIDTPDAVYAFIWAFDKGEFPDLIASFSFSNEDEG